MPTLLATLLARYGYAIVFVGVFLESAGVPVPGETVLLGASFFASRGLFSLPWVIGLGVAAAILGDNLGYAIGRRGGRPLVERHGRLLGLTATRLAAFDTFFQRHGAETVFLARFVTGLRVVAALLAGVSRLPWSQFLFYNAAGALTWATAVALLGYFFGQSWDLLHRWMGKAALFATALVIALGVVALTRRDSRSLLNSIEARLPTGLTLREVTLVALSLGAIGLFAKIAEDVVTQESTGFDRSVSLGLRQVANPSLDLAMWTLSALGSTPVVLAVALGLTAWCLWRRDTRAAATFAIVAVSTEALNLALKLSFHRPRPGSGVVALHGYTFPSGHAMAAMAIYGMAGIVVARLEPQLRRVAGIVTGLLALLIGLSRVYLGVHWATDVLAGFAAGAFILVAGVHALDRAGA
jgi:membrane protein DedA with SNARE-associated domain/membrane-associated phospholipid phosphatase